MLRGLKTQVFYPYSPQQVWRVLTERRSLAAWLMENDFEPQIGHKFQFRTHSLPGLDGVIRCEVREIDAPKRLSYTWQDSYMNQPSIVIWTLTPVAGGTQLQLKHRELNYEVSIVESKEISTKQDLFLDGLPQTTQTLEAIAPSHTFSPTHIAISQISESVILHSLLNGGWKDKLDRRLPNVLVSFSESDE